MFKNTTIFNTLKMIFPFLVWIKKLEDPKVLKKDILAGMTVALVLIPQSMAYAGLAGLPIEVGLYTAFVPIIIAALFGSSPQMSTGPVTIVSLMTATALLPIATSGTEGYIVYASLLAFMIGCVYLIMGTLKLGVIVDFLSHPVIVGFTNAVSIITITSQLPKLFGVTIHESSNYFHSLYQIIDAVISNIHTVTFLFGSGAIILLILLSKYLPKAPKVLIVLIVSIIISYGIGYHDIYGGKIVMDIPNSLPSFQLPFFNTFTGILSSNELMKLGMYAIIIGLIAFTETISVAKIVGYKTKGRISPNKELIGQGLANISSSMFGGYGVAGSFSKTAVNLRAGAQTGFSSVVTGIFVGITLLYLTPLIYHLPFTTLAAIIIFAVANLIKISPIIKAWKIEKHDAIIGVITFIFTIAFAPNLEIGIIIGMILSLTLFIYRIMRPKMVELGMYKDGVFRDIDLLGLKNGTDICIIRFDGPLFFANTGHFESEILNLIAEREKIKYLILDLEWMNNIDSSGMETFEMLIHRLMKLEIKVYLTGVRTKVDVKFIKVNFTEQFPAKRIYAKIDDALKNIEKKYGRKVDTETLSEYSPDKKKDPELEKKVLKQIGDK